MVDSRKGKQNQEKSFLKSPVVLTLLIFAAIGIIGIATLTGAFPLSTPGFQIDIFQSSGASRQTLPSSGDTLEVYAGEPAVGKVTTSNYIITFGQAGSLPSCGDSVAESPEQCDNVDFADDTCNSLGFASGVLSCTDSCTFDDSECKPFGAKASPLRFFGIKPTLPISIDIGESKVIQIGQGQLIDLTIGTVTHSLRIAGIFDQSVEIELESSPVKATIGLGQTKEIDLDNDGVNNIAVTYLSKLLEGVELKVTALGAPKAPAPAPTPPEEAAPTPPAPVAPPAQAPAPTIVPTVSSIIVVLILFTLITVIVMHRIRSRKPARVLTPAAALEGYISREMGRGHSEMHIRQKLLNVGWKSAAIDETLMKARRARGQF